MSDQLQMTLQFRTDLPRIHSSLRECIAAGIYQRGVTAVAGRIDERPSHLSEALAGGTGDRVRKLDVDTFERYMDKTGDLEPLYYLIAKFLPGPEAQRGASLARASTLARQFVEALGEAEMVPSARKRGRAHG